jgi:hypothetical protein
MPATTVPTLTTTKRAGHWRLAGGWGTHRRGCRRSCDTAPINQHEHSRKRNYSSGIGPRPPTNSSKSFASRKFR